MKNNFTKILNYGLSMVLLVMMMTFGLYNAKGQTIDIVTVPAEAQFAGGTATFSYNASGFPVSATQTVTFFLYHVTDGEASPENFLIEDNVLASSTVQGATTTLNITWPDVPGSVDLVFAAFSGDVFSSMDNTTDITEDEFTVIFGADQSDTTYPIDLYRAGQRGITTQAYDLDLTENVRLRVRLGDNDDVNGDDVSAARPISAQYSIDGTAYTSLVVYDAVVSNTPTTEISGFTGSNNDYYFDLPEAAKTAATSFQVVQLNSNTLTTNEQAWDVVDMDITVGDVYTIIDPPGVLSMSTVTDITLTTPTLDVTGIAIGLTSTSVAYPGDEINVTVTLPHVNVANYNYAIILDDEYILSDVSYVVDAQTSSLLTFTGTIPTEIEYGENREVEVWAYDKAATEPIFGLSLGIGSIDLDDLVIEGGNLTNAIMFAEAGDRSVEIPAVNFPSVDEDSFVKFQVGRMNDLISPSGTDLIFEYRTTENGAYTTLGSVSLNELNWGPTWIEFGADFDNELPADIASGSTQVRVRQEGNNGVDLDAWVLYNIVAESGTNIVSQTTIAQGTTWYLWVNRPDVSVDPISITAAKLPYPMTEYTLSYEIKEGKFPALTDAMVMLDRKQDSPPAPKSKDFDYDLILGEITDVSAVPGEISFKVPPIVPGDYRVFLYANGEEYGDIALPTYNVGISINAEDGIVYSNSITVAGNPKGLPGTDITVNYTTTGVVGDDAELMLKVYDYNPEVDDYVLIGASTTIDGSITATLPSEITYSNGGTSGGPLNNGEPTLSLSLGNGVFTLVFDEKFIDLRIPKEGPLPSDIFESIEGNSRIYTNKWWDQALTSEGVRSITTQPFDVPQGGIVRWQYKLIEPSYQNGLSFRIEASIDGDTWEAIDEYDIYAFGDMKTKTELPQEFWSSTTQVRLIYNDNSESDELKDIILPKDLEFRRPKFLENGTAPTSFNLVRPALNVATIDANYIIGESITVEYNAQFFPEDTEFAAVLEQGSSEYIVLGTSAGQGAISISGELPITPLDLDAPDVTAYNVSIVPFTPAVAGGDYTQGDSFDLDLGDDFIEVKGTEGFEDTGNSDKVTFNFNDAGNRSVLTSAFDLSGAESAELSFTFNNMELGFDIEDNKNVVPRLEVSSDGGATFHTIPVYELADGEEQIYDDGLLYTVGGYVVMIPEEDLTDAVHFRWSQPLNQGDEMNKWNIVDPKLEINAGNALSTNLYDATKQSQAISVDKPNIDHYDWAQNDLDDAVFNGDSFDYQFDVDEDVDNPDMFPAGTMFKFNLHHDTKNVIDPDTNENVVIGSTSEVGVSEGSIPFYITNGSYGVHVTSYLMVDDEPYILHDDVWIGSLDVFLKAVGLTYITDEPNANLYAGNTIEFSIDIENVESASESFDDLFVNITTTYATKKWLLATQQGIGNITVDLPPFIRNQTLTFQAELTEEAPLGDAGTILEASSLLGSIEADKDNFTSGDQTGMDPYAINLPVGGGRRSIVTRDFEPGELENARLFSFNSFFNQVPEDLTADQYVKFEVSTDGGATYTEWESFPAEDVEAATKVYSAYVVTDEMRSNPTRLRWSQEEGKGVFDITNVQFSFGMSLPFEYKTTTPPIINAQVINITSLGTEETCIDGDVSVNYEIKGKFGSDNILNIKWTNETGIVVIPLSGPTPPLAYGTIFDVDMDVTQSTGSAVFKLPNDILNEGDAPEEFSFQVIIEDNSFDELLDEVNGTTDHDVPDITSAKSESWLEVVAPIAQGQGFSLPSAQTLCSPVDVIINVTNPIDNYTYELFSVADGSVLGSLTYDADEGDTEINVGMMTGTVEIGINVTSAGSSGAVCNTLTSTYTDITTTVDIYSLYRSRNSGTAVPTVGESEIVCSEDASALTLSLRRQTNSNTGGTSPLNVASDVEWFRDDLANPISGGATLSTFDITGNYFARVTHDGCQYLTESIAIEVLEDIIDIPEITVVSGDLISCDADINVVLSAPDGFAYYLWSTGESTQNITVDEAGSYTVEVSNVPFGLACESPSSLPVVVESAGGIEFQASLTDNTMDDALETANEVEEGDELEACDALTVYFFEDVTSVTAATPTATGTVVVFKDGVEYGSTIANSYVFQESGTYSMTWSSDDLTFSCAQTIGEFTVIINETPVGKPTLTSAGALTACDSDLAVTLTAPAGFSHYKWYFDGDSEVSTSNTLEATNAGEYKVAVGNSENCTGSWSRIITLKAVSADDLSTVGDVVLVTNTQCGASTTSIEVANSMTNNSYQIYNSQTDQPEGSAVVGNGGVITLTSSAHNEVTDFYVMATLTDGSGCTGSPSSDIAGRVNNVLLVATGNIIEAQIEQVNTSSNYEIIWYRDGQKLLGATSGSSSITIIDNATYSVEVIFDDSTDGACSVTSNAITLGGGAGGNVTVPEFASSIYPNPTRDEFNLKVDGEDFGVYSVQILSLSGKVVFRDSFDKQTVDFAVPISVRNLKAGIYTVIINNDNINSTLRISKL